MVVSLLLGGVEVLALAVVFWHCLCALNHMTRQTPLPILVAVVLVFSSTAVRGFMLAIGATEVSLPMTAFATGIALGMIGNRRRSVSCPCLPSWPHIPRRPSQPERGMPT